MGSSFNFFGVNLKGEDPLNIDTYYFSEQVAHEVRYFLHSNAAAINCHHTLEHFTVHSLKVKGSSKAFQNYIDRFYIPFFRNVLENVIVSGWCAYTLRKASITNPETGKKEKVMIPVVVPTDHLRFELVANRTTHMFEIKCYSGDGFTLVKDVRFIFFHDPAKLANRYMMHSPLISLIGEFRFVHEIRKCFVQAEYSASHPMIYLQAAKDSSGEIGNAHQTTLMGTRDEQDFDHASDFGDVVQNEMAGPDAKRRARILQNATTNMAMNFEFHDEQTQEIARANYNNYFNLGLNYRDMRPMYVCPPGMTLASKPDTATTKADHERMEAALASKVMMAMGIPESIFSPTARVNIGGATYSGRGGTHRTAGSYGTTHQNVMHINSFEATLDRYRTTFVNAFIDIYEAIFKRLIPRDKITFEPPLIYKKYLDVLIMGFDDRVIEASSYSSSSTHHEVKDAKSKTPSPDQNNTDLDQDEQKTDLDQQDKKTTTTSKRPTKQAHQDEPKPRKNNSKTQKQ